MKTLVDSGVVSKVSPNGIKLLGKGSDSFSALKTPITLEVSDASQ